MTTPTRRLATLVTALAALGAACSSGPKLQLDPASREFYETARLIMTKEETKIFERLPDIEGRKEFIADFWLKRDPDPDTPKNEYREQFEARVDFVNKRFNKEGGPGYNTDRGRVYIFMGPPDKIEEFPPQPGSGFRGTLVWWSYFDHQMAVEFTDERGDGRYRITDTAGDFFGAMDLAKLGRNTRADDVFGRKFVKFQADYDAGAGEIEVRLPAKELMFRENDEGRLQIDLRFVIYIYPDEGAGKETLAEARSVAFTDAELEAMETVDFRFAKSLAPGTNYVDVLVMAPEGLHGKIRQIFEIKVDR
ncbi:MAG: GWxTD domain-containing protein [Candidatus Aminicenantes bacterium]|nr:GWxTD domain-containing protein [Candidatus Aminicenantes bacterium]